MQNKKIGTEMALLSVPLEALAEAGIQADGILEMYADGNRLIIQNAVETDDFVCDGDCESCPMSETDCTGDCDDCPCNADCDDAEADR